MDKIYLEQVELTKEELKQYNGYRRYYLRLTQSRLWRGGIHDPGHGNIQAGQDLTDAIKESPHGVKELQKFPVVGRLIESHI